MKKQQSKPLPMLSFKDFFTFDEMQDFLRKLASARPKLCSLESLGSSRQRRPIWNLTITDPQTAAADKPAYLIHGGIHATELSGTHAALHTCRRLLAEHDAGKSELLRKVAFHIVPRLNPDGAEFAAKTHGAIRSRYGRDERIPNTLYQEDVNRDGLILTMRQQHANGRFAADPKDDRLLIKRTAQTPGPFFRVMPEGRIHAWDGSDRLSIEGRLYDWNRNWSYDWRPEHEQGGAGDFPFSEPEMRHLAEFLFSKRNLFGLLGYHTGPGAVLRPPTAPLESTMDPADLRELEDLAGEGSRLLGYPVFPNYKYHGVRDPDSPRRGHFNSTGFFHLGLHTFEIELGLIFNSAGVTTQQRLGYQSTEDHEKEARKVLSWWDQNHRRRFPLFHAWRPFVHPQLGEVEIGGIDPKYAAGPSLTELERIAEASYQFTVFHASKHPRVAVEDVRAEAVGDGILRLRCRVANRGAYPTNVTQWGRTLKRMKGVRVEFRPGKGVTLLSRDGHRELGHLDALTGSADLEWFVRRDGGKGTVELRVFGGPGGNSTLTVSVSG